jgi:acetyltransferase-like isoleucine patch superfamily enzyme
MNSTFRRLPVRIAVAVIAVLGASAGVAQVSGHLVGSDDTTRCTGVLGAGSYDNVVVPSGKTCTINSNVRVGDNVVVLSNATLHDNGALIDGSLTAAKGSSLFVSPSGGYSGTNPRIKGNIAASGANQVGIDQASVGGNLSVKNSTGSVVVTRNVVHGNLTVTGNLGSTFVIGNDVHGKANCSSNASFTGGGNVAGGTNTCN